MAAFSLGRVYRDDLADNSNGFRPLFRKCVDITADPTVTLAPWYADGPVFVKNVDDDAGFVVQAQVSTQGGFSVNDPVKWTDGKAYYVRLIAENGVFAPGDPFYFLLESATDSSAPTFWADGRLALPVT